MAAVDEFLDEMPATITLAAFSARTAYGKASYATGVDFRARVLVKDTWVRNTDGRLVKAAGVVWIAGTPTVTAEDQITLPDGSTPPIMNVATIPDEDGPHHVKVWFG